MNEFDLDIATSEFKSTDEISTYIQRELKRQIYEKATTHKQGRFFHRQATRMQS